MDFAAVVLPSDYEDLCRSGPALYGGCLTRLAEGSLKTLCVPVLSESEKPAVAELGRRFGLDLRPVAAKTAEAAVRECFEAALALDAVRFVARLTPEHRCPPDWQRPLADWLDCHAEPLVCCVSAGADTEPQSAEELEARLRKFRMDRTEPGFSLPCLYRAAVLRDLFQTGRRVLGRPFRDPLFLEDFWLYYGTRRDWTPRICRRSAVLDLRSRPPETRPVRLFAVAKSR